MKTKTLLTFDYELYFGENYYNEDEVLFNPTEKLLDTLKKNNIKAVFFIDICSIIAYRNYSKIDYINKFQKQVSKIKLLGHDIQMHFHPHWFNSKYDDKLKKWIFDISNYSYSNLIDNYGLDKANSFFMEAHKLFIDMVGNSPLVFRAGGYTIQPYEKELISLLNSLGYKIDSSVVPYRKYISKAQYFNFLDSSNQNFWIIDNNSFLINGNNNLKEFPILSLKKEFKNIFFYAFLRLWNKFIKDINFDRRGKGTEMKLLEYKNNALTVSFDMTSQKDKKAIKFITDKYINNFNNDILYLNILSHPKAIFKESLEVMEWYIDYMNSKYNNIFIGFDDI